MTVWSRACHSWTTYDLRRLRLARPGRTRPHAHRYHVTGTGLPTAISLARLHDRSPHRLADAYTCRDQGVVPRQTVLTLAPCGSKTTLEFMSWLGHRHTSMAAHADRPVGRPLADSYDQCLTNARTLIAFCRRPGLPFGINVDSLTNRKVEIEASVDPAPDVRDLLR